jgi:sulfur carrier protein ThiS
MDLSTRSESETLICRVRREQVAALPEERVRQRMLDHLIDKLRFPASGIAVEKALSQLPHLQDIKVPERRLDIVCFAKGIHADYDLYPLLILECKAVSLNDAAVRQVAGYNHYVKAPFMAVANETEIRMGWFDREKKEEVFISYIPEYEQLMRSVSHSV